MYFLMSNFIDPVHKQVNVEECSVKKGVLKNFAKFTGKHQCQSLFFNRVADHRCFPANFAKFLRTRFITGHVRKALSSIYDGAFLQK